MAHITQMSHLYKGSFQDHQINSPCYWNVRKSWSLYWAYHKS